LGEAEQKQSESAMKPSPQTPETLERPSKTRLKAEMQALQETGESLARLGREQIERMPISDKLRDAIREYWRITHFSARRRQLQYIGKLMREEDAGAIRAALANLRGASAVEIARQYRLEALRARLLAHEAEALSEIAAAHPAADLTHLRQLRRAALKEVAEQKPPRHFRALFRALKEMETAGIPDQKNPPDGETGDSLPA
jgi:ribosome-associated protein